MMKKKIFIIASAVLVFGLAIAVYALNSTTASNDASVAACCCCSGDSCPAKDKNASAKSATAAHENCDCCKGGGDSCPMRSKDAKTGEKMGAAGDHSCPMMNAHKAGGETKHDMKMGDGESCPMKGDASHKMHAGMKHEMKADGTAGCSCACCADKKEKKDAPAV